MAAAVRRLQATAALAGALPSGARKAEGLPRREIRFRNVSFAYPGGAPVLDRFDLTIPAGQSLAIVGQNGAGKTTIAKLLCRLYDPQGGAIKVDGVDLRELIVDAWRRLRVTAVFQDFTRFEASLRDNVARGGSARGGLTTARFARCWPRPARATSALLDTALAKGYAGGTDLSGGQWQRGAGAGAGGGEARRRAGSCSTS